MVYVMPSEANQLRVAQSVALVRQLPMIIIGNGVGSTIGCFSLSAAGTERSLIPLAFGIWLLLIPMALSWFKLRGRAVPVSVSTRRINLITMHSGVLGLTWAGLELWYLLSAPFAISAFLMAACAFLAVGSVTAVFVIPKACLAYAVPMMAAAVFISIQSDDPVGSSFATLLLLMSVGMGWFLKVNWNGFLTILDLSAEKDRLVSQLATDLVEQKKLVLEKEEAKAALRKANEYLLSLAQTDSLTHLANRRGFEIAIRGEWLRSQRTESSLSVLMVDVDRFKEVNDRFGHSKGDRCLCLVARAIEENVRVGDIVARYGGDEFSILLPETNRNEASEVASRICLGVVAKITEFHISVSVGVATYDPSNTITASELIERADIAMYRAKKRGGNAFSLAPMDVWDNKTS